MIMITKVLTLTTVNADDNDKHNDSNVRIMMMVMIIIIMIKMLQLLTFDINTLNLEKHFATVPSIKVDCKRIPLNQVSFKEWTWVPITGRQDVTSIRQFYPKRSNIFLD